MNSISKDAVVQSPNPLNCINGSPKDEPLVTNTSSITDEHTNASFGIIDIMILYLFCNDCDCDVCDIFGGN